MEGQLLHKGEKKRDILGPIYTTEQLFLSFEGSLGSVVLKEFLAPSPNFNSLHSLWKTMALELVTKTEVSL